MATSGAKMNVSGKVTLSGSISSLRIKPFTQLKGGKQQQFRPRAAEVEAEVPVEAAGAAVEQDNDFEFSLSDAKKNNEYAASDVDAAMRFYFEGAAAPVHNEDFITNLFGEEDASFFDDIDNNEAYDADEYNIAGIPEAAPKKRRGGRKDGGEDADEDDQIAKGKELDKFKAMEDAMVLEAAMEEEYGSDYDRSAESDVAQVVATQGVWDWLTDAEAGAEAGDELARSKLATVRRSRIEMPSDNEVLSGFSSLKLEELDEQTRDLLDLIISDEVTEDELKTLDFNATTDDLPESQVFSQEDVARIDDLASKTLDTIDVELGAMPVQQLTADEFKLEKEFLDSYLSTIKQASSAESDMTTDQVKALFAADGEAVDIDDEAEPADDSELAALIAATEPSFATAAADELEMNEVDQLRVTAEEEADFETKDIKFELKSLASIGDFTEADLPDEAQLAILDQYITSAEDYLQAEEQRKSSAQQLVADGELSPDVFAEDLEEIPDMESDVAEDFTEQLAMDEDGEDALVAYDDEEDTEQWVERIIELNRVTKVVKGGKLMGFRCTAIVGNQNGLVGVGCMAGRDVAVAAKRALVDAKKNIVRVPLVGANTIPHKIEAKFHAARCVLVPASDGTGVIAGGSIKSVLELAGVQNVLAKRIGCRSLLNNARATIKALQQVKSLNEVAKARGVPMDHLLLPK